jgi:hypothetical protein
VAFCPERQAGQQMAVLAFFCVQDGGQVLTVDQDMGQGAIENVEHTDANTVLKETCPNSEARIGRLSAKGTNAPVLQQHGGRTPH